MAVDTKVAEFRTIQFRSTDEMLAEVDRLLAAESSGTLRRTGNWTLGQTLGHLAAWINYSFDGYPPQTKPPWFVKLILATQKRKFLTSSLPRGVKIPKIEGGTLGIEQVSAAEGAARLKAAAARLNAACPTQPSPIFGRLPHDQWIALNLRHAELHLGYLHRP